jgi:hypothetical protein
MRFQVEPASSLAWWQIDPHFGYLWATTCPQDPSWQPGEVHSPGFRYKTSRDPVKGIPLDKRAMERSKTPVYQRDSATAICTPSVKGEIVAADTTSWKGTKGLIRIHAADLITGLNYRDTFARERILEADAYPDIQFVIDSLIDVKRRADTLEASAMGKLLLHGTTTPWSIPIKAWHERLGMRVTGQLAFPAKDLVSTYKFGLVPLGLGVGAGMWKWMHLGIDAIIVPQSPSGRAE